MAAPVAFNDNYTFNEDTAPAAHKMILLGRML
jgi:hypothetical protein